MDFKDPRLKQTESQAYVILILKHFLIICNIALVEVNQALIAWSLIRLMLDPDLLAKIDKVLGIKWLPSEDLLQYKFKANLGMKIRACNTRCMTQSASPSV